MIGEASFIHRKCIMQYAKMQNECIRLPSGNSEMRFDLFDELFVIVSIVLVGGKP